MAADSYSRMVGILKVALPLVALAILSTLFLLSSRKEPGSSIPFADGEIADRLRDQRVTGPFFSGVTTSGDKVAFAAEQLLTLQGNGSEARNLSVRLDFAGGGSVALVADQGDVDLEKDVANLAGNVLMESSTGYRMYADTVETNLSTLHVHVPTRVRAVGPAGHLTAEMMTIFNPDGSTSAQVLFSGGVKLIYDPQETN